MKERVAQIIDLLVIEATRSQQSNITRSLIAVNRLPTITVAAPHKPLINLVTLGLVAMAYYCVQQCSKCIRSK